MTTITQGKLESMQHYDIIKNPNDLLRVAEEEIIKCGYCMVNDATDEDECCDDCRESVAELDDIDQARRKSNE